MEITKVTAEGVLGRYDYAIAMGDASGYALDGRMRVLYAPNGRGKTNMLKALSNLLSPSPDSLLALCDAPLRFLSVELAGQSSISIRKADPFDTYYELEVRHGNGQVIVAEAEQEAFSRRSPARFYHDNPKLADASRMIRELHPGAIWIGADRLNPVSGDDIDDSLTRRNVERHSRLRPDVLQVLLDRIERTFSNSALRTVARDQNQVYGRLTKTLLSGKTFTARTATEARAYLEARIGSLLARGAGSSKYGLISLSELKGINDELASVRQNNQQLKTLQRILEPYFEILEKQIDAMEPTRHSVEAFVSSANAFLDDKRVTFSSGDGIALFNDNEMKLSPIALSSGERHILLLLAQSVIAADRRKLLVIDEPEISLGIDWQRRLLVNLLKCTSSADPGPDFQEAQVLVATHSLQVMGEVEPSDIVTVEDAGPSGVRVAPSESDLGYDE